MTVAAVLDYLSATKLLVRKVPGGPRPSPLAGPGELDTATKRPQQRALVQFQAVAAEMRCADHTLLDQFDQPVGRRLSSLAHPVGEDCLVLRVERCPDPRPLVLELLHRR